MSTDLRRATLGALVSATLMIAHQVGGKATRDALFLSQFEVTQLPRMVIAAALLSMLAVLAMSRLLGRHEPYRLVPALFLASGLVFLGIWQLHAATPALAALALYAQMAVFGAILISGFWSVVNERFDPHTAKRTIARVAAAATLGGVLGGVLAERVALLLDAGAMIAVLGMLHLACAASVWTIGRPPRASQPRGLEVESGVAQLVRNRYLLSMAALMVLVAALAALVDYVFKAEAARTLGDEAALVALFGRFYAAVGLATFLVQWLLGPRLLSRFGIGTTLAVLPGLVLMAGLLSVFALRLWSVVLLRGGQMIVQNSFFRSAFELLHTPLPPSRKRPTKSIIDVASDRLGDVVGGGLVLGLLALAPSLPGWLVIAFALLLAVLTLLVVKRLYDGYVGQLADNLRDGSLSLRDDEIVDATTRQILAEASATAERTLIEQRIAGLRRARGGSMQTKPRSGRAPAAGSAIAAAVAALTSGDLVRIRACLDGRFMDARLAPFIVPLLAVDSLADLARTELRFLVPHCIGTLGDALFDPDVPLLARQRLPSVLEVSHHPRVIETLERALEDAEFNVRYSSARALSRMRGRDAALAISSERVFAACAREVAVSSTIWQERDIRPDELNHADEHLTAPNGGNDYGLEHVFTLLSLVLDRDALKLSFRALFSNDIALRGTALEYLENVLPDDLRAGLWPHLGEVASTRRGARPAATLVRELERGARR